MKFVMVVLLMLSAGVQAQVIKCTHPKTGKITYASTPCEAGHASKLIEDVKSTDEILAERQRAAEANGRLNRNRPAEPEGQRFAQPAAAPVPPAPTVAPPSYECLRAQRDLETISSIRTGSEEERRNRINAANVKVNILCGTQTELIQPPARPVLRRDKNSYP